MTHPGHPVGTVCVVVGPLSSPRLGNRCRVVGGPEPDADTEWVWDTGDPIPLPIQEIVWIDRVPDTPDTAGRMFWSAPLLRPLDEDTDARDEEVIDHYTLGKIREPSKAA